MSPAPRRGLGSSGRYFGGGWRWQLGTETGQEVTTARKVALPPAHTVPLTISQVWVLPRGPWAGLKPFHHFSCPLLSLLSHQAQRLARLLLQGRVTGLLPRADVPALASAPSLSASACRSSAELVKLGAGLLSCCIHWEGSALPEMPWALRTTSSLAGSLGSSPSSPALSGAAGAPCSPPSVSDSQPWSGSSWLLQPSVEAALGQEQPLVLWAQQLLVLIKNGETQQLAGCDSPCCCWGQGRGGAGQPGGRLDP